MHSKALHVDIPRVWNLALVFLKQDGGKGDNIFFTPDFQQHANSQAKRAVQQGGSESDVLSEEMSG